jgi:hypothetical protein
MKFSAREDIEAPIDYVFRQVTDFEGFERAAMRRGADVEKFAGGAMDGVGTSWKVGFDFRGKARVMDGKLVELSSPNWMKFDGKLSGLQVELAIELVELSKRRTRLSVTTDLTPSTLSARLLLQSLKLAKNSLTKKYKMRVATFATDLEDRHRKFG